MERQVVYLVMISAVLAGCATSGDQTTLAELKRVPADLEEVQVADSLERAADSYRRFLEQTSASARTPEAMRRLADLQIEREYGVMGGSMEVVEMAAPEAAANPIASLAGRDAVAKPAASSEGEQEFEQRATSREELVGAPVLDVPLPGAGNGQAPAGPQEAIETYWEILNTYPNYERNDQVLYQLSRAYDELGEPDESMRVTDRLVKEFPQSAYVDEVYFRRGEYFFVRKKYQDAEKSYQSITAMGPRSSYYELALYKLGWTLYKQGLYEEALHNYVAMLDYRQSIGYDFDELTEDDEEHRIADTFRVISLSFSNLGGPEVVDEYFTAHGARRYADKIYGNLGEFYFGKLRYEDAASVYKSFIELNPFHRVSPHFSMRVVEIYAEAGFPRLVVEAKKNFATIYSLDAEYWRYFDLETSPDVVKFLKTNLTDLAGHYHALYQDAEFVDERPQSFTQAQHWYREYLHSFPQETESASINYQLADLLLENKAFGDAAMEYERTAYGYELHDQAAAAGYAAVYSHREHLATATGANRFEVMKDAVTSSLRFAEAFQSHEQAPNVLGAAADDQYELEDFPAAIDSARKLIERYPDSQLDLRREAWAVIAHSSIDLSQYAQAENAYINVLDLTAADDESRPAIVDGLAAAIYKQGEQASLLEDYQAAADHFLRIKVAAPSSDIRSAAEYDAAAALMKLQDWATASNVLEEFRTTHPEHELNREATIQLAHVYREAGQIERSALEHERIAAEATETEISRDALLVAGGLYDEAMAMADAVRVYQRYVTEYPLPMDVAMETRNRLAEIFKSQSNDELYYAQLSAMVTVDREAGQERTDRSRFLAGKAALVLAEVTFLDFVSLPLAQPFEQSLAEKQRRMDIALASLEELVGYGVTEVTGAATYYIAETYLAFSTALMESERPTGLSKAEMVDYELVIEEEAFPFEERAIEVHEANFQLLASGVYNTWVQNSLDRLAGMMPGRYAKAELSGGFVGSINTYAYRAPGAAPLELSEEPGVEVSRADQAETAASTVAENIDDETSSELPAANDGAPKDDGIPVQVSAAGAAPN